ncbi:MAG: chemosensory pili system protein ChpC [Pseudohongiellaceae bacterium]|jgi:chemosensory pili system protein ChpC
MSSTPVTNESANEIPSLLVPMYGYKLVLPTVSVAEMVAYQAPQLNFEHSNNAPQWFLGNFLWRGVKVPMISYEVLNNDALPTIKDSSQLVIINKTCSDSRLNFICMPTQGIPRLSRVAVNEISENTRVSAKLFDQMQVFVAGEQAIIPDLESIERECEKLESF